MIIGQKLSLNTGFIYLLVNIYFHNNTVHTTLLLFFE